MTAYDKVLRERYVTMGMVLFLYAIIFLFISWTQTGCVSKPEPSNPNCPGCTNPDTSDPDGDGIPQEIDNCPAVSNPDQSDADLDGDGDLCDSDDDNDGVRDVQDNCPYLKNPDQEDSDGDNLGDLCDDDVDLPVSRAYRLGVAPWKPVGMSEEEAFELIHDELGEVVLIDAGVDWDRSAGSYQNVERQVTLARDKGLKVYLTIDPVATEYRYTIGPLPSSWTDPGSPDFIPEEERVFANETIRAHFLSWCALMAEDFQPDFLAVGIETDMYSFPTNLFGQMNPDYGNWVSLYKEAYDEVKTLSPDTVVFTSFQYDQIVSYYFLGIMNVYNNRWNYIRSFEPQIDMVGFSMFPHSNPLFSTPENIRNDYYDIIRNQISLPIAIAETGWPDNGWGGEDAQMRFVPQFLKLAKNLPTRLIVWYFLTDPSPAVPGLLPDFYHSGLLRVSGTEKKVEGMWGDLADKPFIP